jgi:hypothetical protein
MQDGVAGIFGDQKIISNSTEWATSVHRNKIHHPNVTVIRDIHFTVKNKTKKPKYSSFNRLFPSKTVWRYPTTIYDGSFHRFDKDKQYPDCKMYFIILAMPLTGIVHDPGQAQHGFVLDEQDDQHLPQPMPPARSAFEREGSIVDDRFGEPVAGPSRRPDLEVLQEEGQTQEDPPQRITHSKGKGPENQGNENENEDGDDEDDNIKMQDAFVQALEINRANARSEREKANGAVDHPRAIDKYGWSENQTIMIKPTFKIWWRGMAARKYVRTFRFSKRRLGHFRK